MGLLNETKREISIEIAPGKFMFIQVGKLAKQAHGSAVVRMGDTSVLVTACEGNPAAFDFFPLTVEYREASWAAGRIPGGYFKREGKPSEKEILTCRIIDRPIRPMFPDGYKNEVQIIGTVISADDKYDPDVLSLVGGAAAHVGAVELKRKDGIVPCDLRKGGHLYPGGFLQPGGWHTPPI